MANITANTKSNLIEKDKHYEFGKYDGNRQKSGLTLRQILRSIRRRKGKYDKFMNLPPVGLLAQ